jgi:hypothetical protein
MRNPLASIYFDLFRLGCESSLVISLRMMTFAAGGTKAMSEAQLMTSEKVAAAMAVTYAGAVGLATGQSAHALSRDAVAHYHRKVVANRRRLLRRR